MDVGNYSFLHFCKTYDEKPEYVEAAEKLLDFAKENARKELFKETYEEFIILAKEAEKLRLREMQIVRERVEHQRKEETVKKLNEKVKVLKYSLELLTFEHQYLRTEF